MENNKIQIHPLPIGINIYTFKGDGQISSCVSHSKNVWLYTVKNEINEFTVYSDEVFLVKEACLAAKEMQSGKIESTSRQEQLESKDMVNHPEHYGGKDNPMEVIKIINHYNLGFELGNTIKYILRADKKENRQQDLEKALWYLQHEINKHGK